MTEPRLIKQKRNLGSRDKAIKSSHPAKTGTSPRPVETYTFKDDIIDTWFYLLEKSDKLKLPEICRPDEVGRVGGPNYCRYNRILGHPTKSFYQLGDILQAVVDAGALKPHPKQKTVSTDMTSSL